MKVFPLRAEKRLRCPLLTSLFDMIVQVLDNRVKKQRRWGGVGQFSVYTTAKETEGLRPRTPGSLLQRTSWELLEERGVTDLLEAMLG